MVALMTTPLQRSYTWGSTTGNLILAVALVLYLVGTVSFVVLDPPGLFFTGAVLHIVASSYMMFATSVLTRESRAFYTPVLGFATAAFAGSVVAGVGAGAGASGLPAGAVAAKGAGAGTGIGGAPTTATSGAGGGTGGGALTIRQPAAAAAPGAAASEGMQPVAI
jgi:hypothetical protein